MLKDANSANNMHSSYNWQVMMHQSDAQNADT